MKIALLLSILCAASFLAGCSTPQGGTSDEYGTSSGWMQQREAVRPEPSLPQDPNVGPSIPPP